MESNKRLADLEDTELFHEYQDYQLECFDRGIPFMTFDEYLEYKRDDE